MKKSKKWFLPVDHRNLRAFYARGLVVPRILMPKYRQDLLADSPRVLPLFSDHPGCAVIDKCSGGGDGFPVVLEISGDAVPQGSTQTWGGGIVTAIGTVIPTSCIVAVYVRHDREAGEIRSREYRNVDPADIPLTVDPAVFEGDVGDVAALVEWLSNQPGLKDSDAEALRDREAIAGSAMLVLDGLPSNEVITRKTAALFSGLATVKREPLTELPSLLDQLMWLEEADDVAIAACSLLVIAAQSGPEPPTASEVLTGIRHSLNAVALVDRAAADKYLDGIERIVRGEDEFRPFREHGGLRSLKALLLFLLRPEANRTKVWMQEDINAEDEVTALALVYSGLSLSAAGIPTAQRGTRLLQEVLSAWCAIPFNDRMRNVGNLACEVVMDHVSMQLVKPDGGTLRLWEAEGELLRERLRRSAQESGKEAVGLARALAWNECIEWVFECESMSVERAGGQMVVRLQAFREPSMEVKGARFNERLAALGDDEIRAHLGEVVMAPVKPAPRKRSTPRKPKVKKSPEESVGPELPLE